MATKSFEITAYAVHLGSRGTPINYIMCWGSEPDHTFSISFVKDIDSAPRNRGLIEPNKIYGSIYVPQEQYAWYLDLLRNESPVYADIDDERPDFANVVRSGAEPVGEGDL